MQYGMLMPANTIIPASNNKYLDSDGYTNNPVSIVDMVHSNANAIQAVYLAILPIVVLGMDIILSNFFFCHCVYIDFLFAKLLAIE